MPAAMASRLARMLFRKFVALIWGESASGKFAVCAGDRQRHACFDRVQPASVERAFAMMTTVGMRAETPDQARSRLHPGRR